MAQPTAEDGSSTTRGAGIGVGIAIGVATDNIATGIALGVVLGVGVDHYSEHGSVNWEKQRRVVAERHADLKQKRRDFLHKLSNYYAREYDLVAVEDLDAKGLVELPGNSRNRAGAAWGTFLRMLEYKCKRGDALRGGQSKRDDQGVCVVRRFDGEAIVGP